MKVYNEIQSFAEFDANESANIINRLYDYNVADEAFAIVEKEFPNGCTSEQLDAWLCNNKGVFVDLLGWDFFNYDSEEEYNADEEAAWAELDEDDYR